MDISANNQRKDSHFFSRAAAYSGIIIAGFVLLFFFSQPNRLAHDQIDHALVLLKAGNPQTLQGDYLLGDEKFRTVDNYYSFRFLRWLGVVVGGDELARWILVPVIFILFTAFMFETLFFFTRNVLVSFGVSFLSNINLFPVFVGEWGLPGPTGLDPWTFVFAFYPLLFLLFYWGVSRKKIGLLVFVFLLSGLLGNLHIISVFNIIGIFLLTYLLLEGVNKKTLTRSVLFGVLSVLLSVPVLVQFSLDPTNHITSFDPENSDVWSAIMEPARHVTLSGKIEMVKIWLTYQWYFIWPAILVFVVVTVLLRRYRRTPESDFYRRFSLMFIVATFLFNGGFTLIQLFRLYILHQTPMYNEPRGVHFIYILFFISLALLLQWFYEWIKKKISYQTRVALLITSGFVGIGILFLSYPAIQAFSTIQTRAPYTFLSCDSEMFRQVRYYAREGDTILADPFIYGTMRMCTLHPVVVQSRDRALAYTLGSDKMMEWYYRFQDVVRAYKQGGKELVRVARKYGAAVVVSRFCSPIPEEDRVFSKKLPHPEYGHQGCIYRLR